MKKNNIFKVLLIFVFALFILTSCGPSEEELISEFKEEMQAKIESEITTELYEGDTLPSVLEDGTKLEWQVVGTAAEYFEVNSETGVVTCLGCDIENGTSLAMTCIFIKADAAEINFSQELQITILDNKIRNTESGIPDKTLYDLMVLKVDANDDGKITIDEAKALTGEVVIEKDAEGIVASDTIETTVGLQHFPNIKVLKFKNLKINNLIISNISALEELYYDNDSTINVFNVSNQLKLKKIELVISAKVNKLIVGPNINVVNLNLRSKSLSEITISNDNVTIFNLDLSDNNKLDDFSFLSNINSLESLKLENCSLTDTIVGTIPQCTSLKDIDFSDNPSVSKFDFLTSDKFPKLESLDLSNNLIDELILVGFDNFTTLNLEQLEPENNIHIQKLRLEDMPSFTHLNRSKEIKISTIELIDLPKIETLDLTISGPDAVSLNHTIKTLYIESCGVKSITRNEQLEINNLTCINLFNLKVLNLTACIENSITFEDMQALETLILDKSNISSFEFLNGSPNIKELSLGDLDLTEDKLSQITNCVNLLVLNISNNKAITNYGILTNFAKLKSLDISRNNINDTIFATIPELSLLEVINLSYNNSLTKIEFNAWDKLNKIDITADDDGQWILEEISLVDLPCFETLVRTASTKVTNVLLSNLPVLKSINLSNSSVVSILISNVLNLVALDVSGNTNISVSVE